MFANRNSLIFIAKIRSFCSETKLTSCDKHTDSNMNKRPCKTVESNAFHYCALHNDFLQETVGLGNWASEWLKIATALLYVSMRNNSHKLNTSPSGQKFQSLLFFVISNVLEFYNWEYEKEVFRNKTYCHL